MALSGKLVQTNIARNKCLCLENQTNPEKICLLENTNLYCADLLISLCRLHSLVSVRSCLCMEVLSKNLKVQLDLHVCFGTVWFACYLI